MGIEQTLKRAEIFLGLDDSELCQIANLPSSREESYQAQQIIFEEGDRAGYLYVLKEGQVYLVTEIPPDSGRVAIQVTIDTITKGGVFGWSALVPPHPYALSAICHESSIVVLMSGDELSALFERENHIGYKVLQSLTRIISMRLRDVEQVLIKGQRWPFL